MAAGSIAARESLGAQVACRLALEHFVEAVLDFEEQRPEVPLEGPVPGDGETSVAILEHAFRRANTSVYQFGHKLAAGGRMATSVIGLVIEDRIVAVGRVGTGSVYLIRGSEFCPFFERGSRGGQSTTNRVGENSIVTVELSSIPIEPGDSVVLLPRVLETEQEEFLRDLLLGHVPQSGEELQFLIEELLGSSEEIPFSLVATIGPEAIYLDHVVNV